MRAALEREKALVLRSIKELEFDRAMGKVSPKDFDEMAGRLRARAIDADEAAGCGRLRLSRADRARAAGATEGTGRAACAGSLGAGRRAVDGSRYRRLAQCALRAGR